MCSEGEITVFNSKNKLQYNMLSHGSEGFVIFMYQKIKLNINTLSHGSEEYLVVANSFDDCIN